jgi:hypothetical protein
MLPTFSFFPSAHHTLGGREWGSLDVHQHAAGGGGNMLTAHRRSPHSSEMGAGDRSPHAQTWNTQTQHGRAGIDGSALNLHSLLSTETKSAAGGRVGNLVGAKEGVDEGGGQLPYTGRENHEQMLRSMQILQSNQLLQGAYGSAMLQSLMQNQNQQSSSDQPVVTQASRQMSMGLGTSGGMGMSSAMPSLLFHSLVSNMHPSLHGFPQGAGVGFPGVAPGGAGAVNSRSPSLLPSKKLEGVAESLPASSSFSLSDSSDQRDSVAEDSAASPRTGLGAVSGSSKGSPVIAGGSVGRHSKYCHFCQHIKNTMIACTSPQCTFKFCHHCISVHLNEDWDAVTETRERGWRCPCWFAPTPPISLPEQSGFDQHRTFFSKCDRLLLTIHRRQPQQMLLLHNQDLHGKTSALQGLPQEAALALASNGPGLHIRGSVQRVMRCRV